ncbi:Peroxin-3 [Gloeopeniophorella convolvens]|nr:Peroxin-3 [Gloeopeniophorella convolvens]
MLNTVSNYLYDRRARLAKTAGVVGGLYLAGQYAMARIDDVRERIVQERTAREHVRKRFQQNMQDISFTVMTYLPMLSQHVLDEMDVEALTSELQALSRARREGLPVPRALLPPRPEHSPAARSSASLDSSVELVRRPSDALSDAGSASVDLAASQMSAATRSKAEIWREVKMLTVTRTLTVLYSITLLTIFTNIQLSLLGRYKYIQSIMQLEREEEARAQQAYETSLSALLFPSLVDRARAHDVEALLGQKAAWEDDGVWREGVDAETERKYLTLSWWILNVGWKDVGERVRRGVEEVFEGVSLKSKIGVVELYRLISDVRRRVEHEITFEGTERRTNFLSTLLPPTSSALSHLLTRGGFPPAHGDTHEPAFAALLEETRDLLASADFALVLERALDRAAGVLFDGLARDVFVGDDADPDAPADAEAEAEVRLRTASVLPGLARWSSLALNGMPNELVDSLADLHEVAGFAAIIYSDYEDRFR